MKAIVLRRYGGPEVLNYADVQRPTAGPGGVLVRVPTTSINAADAMRHVDHGHVRGKVVLTV